jgi:hypothetical protein
MFCVERGGIKNQHSYQRNIDFLSDFMIAADQSAQPCKWNALSELNPQSEVFFADIYTASQEMPRLLWNSNVHQNALKNQLLDPVLKEGSSPQSQAIFIQDAFY